MKKKQYKVRMINEDNGRRVEIMFKGSLAECKKYIKDTLDELTEDKDDDAIEIWEHNETSIKGTGHRGVFSYEII